MPWGGKGWVGKGQWWTCVMPVGAEYPQGPWSLEETWGSGGVRGIV